LKGLISFLIGAFLIGGCSYSSVSLMPNDKPLETVTMRNLEPGMKCEKQLIQRYGKPQRSSAYYFDEKGCEIGYMYRGFDDYRPYGPYELFEKYEGASRNYRYCSRGLWWTYFRGGSRRIGTAKRVYEDFPVKRDWMAMRFIVSFDQDGKIINYAYNATFLERQNAPTIEEVKQLFTEVYGIADEIIFTQEAFDWDREEDGSLNQYHKFTDGVDHLYMHWKQLKAYLMYPRVDTSRGYDIYFVGGLLKESLPWWLRVNDTEK